MGRTLPTPRNWIAGEVDTGAYMNAVRAWMQFLQTPPAAKLRQTAAQTTASGTAAAVVFDTEDLDVDGGHSTTSNTSRYVAQVAGWYWVSGTVGFTGNATGSRLAWLQLNGLVSGTTVLGTEVGFGTVPNAGHVELTVPATLVYLNAGDYIELVAFQSSTINLNTFLSGAIQPMMSVLWASL